jgi:hypothetical protein
MDTESELDYLDKQIEENLRLELKSSCFKEKNYSIDLFFYTKFLKVIWDFFLYFF